MLLIKLINDLGINDFLILFYMSSYKDGNTLVYGRSDGGFKVQYDNTTNNGASLSGNMNTKIMNFSNGEKTLYVYFRGDSSMFNINFNGSHNRSDWFYMPPDNGDASASPPYSRPVEVDNNTTPIFTQGGGAAQNFQVWKFTNIPQYVRWYNPIGKTGVYTTFKTLKN